MAQSGNSCNNRMHIHSGSFLLKHNMNKLPSPHLLRNICNALKFLIIFGNFLFKYDRVQMHVDLMFWYFEFETALIAYQSALL